MMISPPGSAPAPTYSGVTFYDAGIIERFADKLYARAASIVVVYALLGAFVALGAGVAIFAGIQNVVVAIIAGATILVIAILLGQQRAFQLRLQAQLALCQVQIERNTRQRSDATDGRQ